MLWFVCIPDRQPGVKKSDVPVPCFHGWCWAIWSSFTGHGSTGNQSDLLVCFFFPKVRPNPSSISVLPTFQLLPLLSAWVPSKAAKGSQEVGEDAQGQQHLPGAGLGAGPWRLWAQWHQWVKYKGQSLEHKLPVPRLKCQIKRKGREKDRNMSLHHLVPFISWYCRYPKHCINWTSLS